MQCLWACTSRLKPLTICGVVKQCHTLYILYHFYLHTLTSKMCKFAMDILSFLLIMKVMIIYDNPYFNSCCFKQWHKLVYLGAKLSRGKVCACACVCVCLKVVFHTLCKNTCHIAISNSPTTRSFVTKRKSSEIQYRNTRKHAQIILLMGTTRHRK